ncbi:G-type lectin S-receptor-like serine/threonine-protein kinase At4g27290 [Magnolia sinica]|uniref:G-type lectin S-receptor-like serine/threonine-protein kinase At4g27290 n=1 Tax=Magnolia sinica TaxID=86752 RepID=UPI002659BED4|nr:G-type lectin S-receptor-like serine/threonine-protein kinase At4g27290 [Magnolia sinica]
MASISSTYFFHLLFIFSTYFSTSHATSDALTQGQSIVDGQTLVSEAGIFELGFFSPGGLEHNCRLGIWYHKVPEKTVVWIANRQSSSSALMINEGGDLIIRDTGGVSSTVASGSGKNNTSLKLMDSGNLVFFGDSHVLWQSFDEAVDTFLPGMRLGVDKNSKREWILTSHRTLEDPSPGWFFLRLDRTGTGEQFYIWSKVPREGNINYGDWRNFSSVSRMFEFMYVSNENETYVTYSVTDSSIISRFVLDLSGQIKQWTWSESARKWQLGLFLPNDPCKAYAPCGAYSSCKAGTSLQCNCLPHFSPRFPGYWKSNDYSAGCISEKPMHCGHKDGFILAEKMSFSKDSEILENSSLVDTDCKSMCLSNCSCTAFTSAHENGTGCLFWHKELVSLRENYDGGRRLYVRVRIPETLCVCVLGTDIAAANEYNEANDFEEEGKKNGRLPLFSFSSIACATGNFCAENKLGEGGFGPVYKGKLIGGKEIAVKRLSRSSGQGLVEFKNEIILIAKLQHTNLVKLLGCCIQGEEKILIYEYMPNKSLDKFLFDSSKRAQLDWGTRFHIIEGIAQGLLYLHKYSRLRIIHRDMKASNILLDSDMNPKISDFGMARIFGGNVSQENTNRVVGTYGYMASEYIMHGLFSVKSDVFSFGVILLEIVSGKKNTDFRHPTRSLNLLGHAWEFWKDGKAMELMDPLLDDPSPLSQLLRCIHVALLCVQDCAKERPAMSAVISMLTSETANLPMPKQPAFFIERSTVAAVKPTTCSINHVTVSTIEAR